MTKSLNADPTVMADEDEDMATDTTLPRRNQERARAVGEYSMKFTKTLNMKMKTKHKTKGRMVHKGTDRTGEILNEGLNAGFLSMEEKADGTVKTPMAMVTVVAVNKIPEYNEQIVNIMTCDINDFTINTRNSWDLYHMTSVLATKFVQSYCCMLSSTSWSYYNPI